MKRTLFILGIIISSLTSCNKIAEQVFGGVEVTIPDFQVTIPTIVAVTSSEVSLGTYSFHYNLDSVIRATTGIFNINSVSSVKIKQVTMRITNPDPLNNFANFQSARISIQSNNNSTPSDLVSVTFPDAYASTYTSTTAGADLLPYFKGTDFSYTVYGKMRRVTTKPLTITLSVVVSAL